MDRFRATNAASRCLGCSAVAEKVPRLGLGFPRALLRVDISPSPSALTVNTIHDYPICLTDRTMISETLSENGQHGNRGTTQRCGGQGVVTSTTAIVNKHELELGRTMLNQWMAL